MEGADSGRGSSSEGFKADPYAELYESIEVWLYDREVRRLLCSLEDGIYRSSLADAFKRLFRPIMVRDVENMINNMIQLGVFEVEMRTPPPTPLPKHLLIKKKKTKEGVIEILQPPKGFEIIGVYGDTVLLRTVKMFLKPSKLLKSVCSVLEPRG
jgi:hypothetical protein